MRLFHLLLTGVVLLGAARPGPVRAQTTGAGRWGVPTETCTLPGPNSSDAGLYVADVQTRCPGANWATLDRLYLPAGRYSYMYLGNLPRRSASDPLVITNKGGQVRIGGIGGNYLLSINGGSGWVLTGRYDPVSQTGDAGFTGHADGAYGNSAGRYGIMIDDAFRLPSGMNTVGRGATQFELEFIEITRVGFAGLVIKTDNDASAVMEGVRLHDLYIHDTGSEGLYIGSTQAQPQHVIRDLEIYNNRILRAGTEAIQVGQLADGVEIHHNVFALAAIRWKSAFQPYQDNNLQIGYRTGRLDIHHNVFIGSAGAGVSLFALDIAGDAHTGGDGVTIFRNYFAGGRGLGAYVNDKVMANTRYVVADNFFRDLVWQRSELGPGETNPLQYWRLGGGTAVPMTFTANRFDLLPDIRPISVFADAHGNGAAGAVSASGNARAAIAPIQFANLGVEAGYDYAKVEFWAAAVTVNGSNTPITYGQGDIAFHNGRPYRCLAVACRDDRPPDQVPALWAADPVWPDDVRLAPGSPYAGIGLLDTAGPPPPPPASLTERMYLPALRK